MSTPALFFDGVSKSFNSGKTSVTALDGVTISALPGKVTGLIGPDGAGKTTLMRLAVGLLLPDNGNIQALGIDVLEAPLQVQSSVGYMPQRFGLYEDLSVQENLDLYADLQGVGHEQRQARYEELLQMTALGPFTDRLAGRLSGGMKQKLGLACTLIKIPRLLLLDEPTVGVDPISRRELWAIIDRLVKQEQLSVLVSTAYLNEAERCDEVVLLNEGRRLGQGSPKSYSEPMRGRTFHLSSTRLDKRRLQTQLSAIPGIIDAVIDGEKVRVVTRKAQLPDISDLVADGDTAINGPSKLDDLQIEPVEPSFEDAFIATLKVDTPSVADWFAPRDGAALEAGPIIEVVNAQRRFGDFYAVRDISFKVKQGEIFGLLGANGAGKSTMFRMLCGLLPASAGQLTVAGHDLRRAAADARSRLGYMAQRFSLYVDLSVAQNLNFFASAYGLGRKQRKQRIEWAMAAFELTAYAATNSGDLPLGYKQRLAMAAALLHEPDILFLDEPTSGVDPLARREFWQRINGLAASGVTILVTTHFMDEANYCDRLVIMAEGEVLAEGTPTQMKAGFRSAALPSPTMEDAFIGLIENRQKNKPGVAA
ncbi:MAG: ABC transporter ATP-binding protein [Gammaproteobacteria bacterium]|nr:ABC transporter ATP-binding protein [Gammaproteobacteria bacterium]MBQ0840961.1 ABC transporter ATP-binding protein [Gammaproteobacteria bacterium]